MICLVTRCSLMLNYTFFFIALVGQVKDLNTVQTLLFSATLPSWIQNVSFIPKMSPLLLLVDCFLRFSVRNLVLLFDKSYCVIEISFQHSAVKLFV